MAKWQPMLSGLLLKYIRRFFKLTPLPCKIFLEPPLKIMVIFNNLFFIIFTCTITCLSYDISKLQITSSIVFFFFCLILVDELLEY